MTVLDALPVSSSSCCCCSTSGRRWEWQHWGEGGGGSRGSATTGRPAHARLPRRDGNQLRLLPSLRGELGALALTSARSASRNTTRRLCERKRTESRETFATVGNRGNAIQTTCCPATPQLPQRIGQFRALCLRSATLELVSYLRHCSISEFRRRGNGKKLQGSDTWSVKALQDDLSYQREETRWLREEQRWLREEQRWLAQETRLAAENDALKEEVATLKQELAQLQLQRESGDVVADSSLRSLVLGLRSLLESLAPPAKETFALEGEVGEVLNSGSLPENVGIFSSVQNLESEPSLVTTSSTPEKVVAVVRPTADGSAAVSPVQVSPTSSVPVSSLLTNETLSNTPAGRKRRTLKSGMEGDDVKELQDTLAKLGFYSGEEDMEDSVFSIGTASAVKTWQATVGIPQDGVVTAESFLAMLAEPATKVPSGADDLTKAVKAGAKVPSRADELTQAVKADPKPSKVENSGSIKSQPSSDLKTFAKEISTGSSTRVYLLGENRWEEPGRVSRKQDAEKIISNGATSVTNFQTCFGCRGVGTVMCTDCEGTGDLNVEEQFLEWTDEGARCPYCDGLGAVVCDMCNGAAVVAKT